MDAKLISALQALSPVFIEYLESLRNKNPLKGSDGGKNSNSVFVEIGKNLVVDKILADIDEARNPRQASTLVEDGSEIMTGKIVM